MAEDRADLTCDLMVIGSGMAGMAAGLFAAQQQIDTVQVGISGEITFASGLLDLLGVHPIAEGRLWQDPWEGISRLIQDEPRHPYARVGIAAIRQALQAFLSFLQKAGYAHVTAVDTNLEVLTPAGTIKPTYALPHTMSAGCIALAHRAACLLVDFHGLKGYSARQIAACLAPQWPQLQTVRLAFPESKGELYTERMARALENPAIRQKLAAAIKPHVGGATVVGLPAVLGIHRCHQVVADLQQSLGRSIFEVPTMMPSVAGLRLRELFEQQLPAMGIRALYQQRVLRASPMSNGRWLLDVGADTTERRISARAVVLCSGRFFGKGLQADRGHIRETIFNLPLYQPSDRAAWHHKDLLHPHGHPLNRAGLAVDRCFRPVDARGRTLHPNLFVAGSILAHQDWVRQKCGSGLAIATAYGAIQACKAFLSGDSLSLGLVSPKASTHEEPLGALPCN